MNSVFYVILFTLSVYSKGSQHYIVESDQDLKRLADTIIEVAESQYNEIRRIMPVEFEKKITIKIAGSLKEYESLQPEGYRAPIWSVGIAYPEKGLIILRVDSAYSMDDILKTFRHELAHIFLHNFSNKKIPKWFSEGFSMYFEERGSLARSFRLMRQAFANSYIDIDTLEDSFPDDPVDVHNAYLTASEFFSYLLSEIGEEGLYRVLEYVKEGADFRYAIYKVSQKTVSEMERDFKKTSRFRYAWLPVITSSTTLWILLTLFFIYVFVVKKRRTDERLEVMRAEEYQALMEKFEEIDKKSQDPNRYLN